MNQKRISLALLIVLALPGWAREVPVTLLHTTDIHGRLSRMQTEDNAGGMLCAASVVDRVRDEAAHVLLVDAGDLIQGSAISYRSKGHIMRRAMEWMEYDAFVPGNHEFDWGWDVLAELVRDTSVPVIGANISHHPAVPDPMPDIHPYRLVDVDGVTVALIGLTTAGIPTWSRPALLGDVHIKDPVETLMEVMRDLRSRDPDVLILVTHQGYRPYDDEDVANQVAALAEAFPELDVIIGGHSHRPIGEKWLGGILFAQAGEHAEQVGRVDLVYDTEQDEVTEKRGRLIPLDDVPPHPDMAALFREELQATKSHLQEVIGKTEVSLERSSNVPGHSVQQALIAQALMEETGADMALHGDFGADPIPPGEIREEHLWALVPYENRIGVVSWTAEQLRTALDENAGLYGSSRFMGLQGGQYVMDPDAPAGRRVWDVRGPEGEDPHPRKRYRVALNSYVLASGGRRFPKIRKLADAPESRLELLEVQTRDALRSTIRRHTPIRPVSQPTWVRGDAEEARMP